MRLEPIGNEVEAMGVEINNLDKRVRPAAYPRLCSLVTSHDGVMSPDAQEPPRAENAN